MEPGIINKDQLGSPLVVPAMGTADGAGVSPCELWRFMALRDLGLVCDHGKDLPKYLQPHLQEFLEKNVAFPAAEGV